MYSERARRYMAAMEARHGPDYLHELYEACKPITYVDGEEWPQSFADWVEDKAWEWEASQRPAQQTRQFTAREIKRMRLDNAKAELARLQSMGWIDAQTQYRIWVLNEFIRRHEGRGEVSA